MPREEALAAFAAGTLTGAQEVWFAEECRRSPALLSEAVASRDAFARIADTARAVDSPPVQLRARILAAATGRGRLSAWTDRIAQYFEISREKSCALLDEIDEVDTWDAGPLPGISLLHFSAGPRAAGKDAGFARFEAGVLWPSHRHLGEERMLILSGAIVDSDGRRWGEGDEVVMAVDTIHSFTVTADAACVAAVLVEGGIELVTGG